MYYRHKSILPKKFKNKVPAEAKNNLSGSTGGSDFANSKLVLTDDPSCFSNYGCLQ